MPSTRTILFSLALAGLFAGPTGCRVMEGAKSAITAPKRWIANRDGDDGATVEDGSGAPGPNGSPAGAGARTPEDPGARADAVARAEALMRARRFREAQAALEGATADGAGSARAYALLGDCHYRLKHHEAAATAYEAALDIDGGYFPALRGLGYVLLSRANRHYNAQRPQEAYDDYSAALRRLRVAHKLRPDDDQVVYARAWAAEGVARFFYTRAINLRARGDLQGAETQYDKCVGFIREALDAAEAYQGGHLTEALPRALIGRLRLRRAMLAHEFGHPEEALAELDKALLAWRGILERVDPDHAEARAEVERLRKLRERWRAEEKALDNLP